MLANEFNFLCATAKFRRPELNQFIIRQAHVVYSDEAVNECRAAKTGPVTLIGQQAHLLILSSYCFLDPSIRGSNGIFLNCQLAKSVVLRNFMYFRSSPTFWRFITSLTMPYECLKLLHPEISHG